MCSASLAWCGSICSLTASTPSGERTNRRSGISPLSFSLRTSRRGLRRFVPEASRRSTDHGAYILTANRARLGPSAGLRHR